MVIGEPPRRPILGDSSIPTSLLLYSVSPRYSIYLVSGRLLVIISVDLIHADIFFNFIERRQSLALVGINIERKFFLPHISFSRL